MSPDSLNKWKNNKKMKCPCNKYIEKQHKNDPKLIIMRHRKHKKYGKEKQNNHKKCLKKCTKQQNR